ncbi:hypothetical protein [Pseudomonas syringae]|uniref:hypothetical protein n=1 Tax=Pseudomonas syringae TaxID=317 RepID=UPI001F20AB8E|nr:hypothetical protein [Pseudomonas syringae]MCF5374502.1 hypothetical protein [Pseudomonas syringae]
MALNPEIFWSVLAALVVCRLGRYALTFVGTVIVIFSNLLFGAVRGGVGIVVARSGKHSGSASSKTGA